MSKAYDAFHCHVATSASTAEETHRIVDIRSAKPTDTLLLQATARGGP
jgi:hypothetical protein